MSSKFHNNLIVVSTYLAELEIIFAVGASSLFIPAFEVPTRNSGGTFVDATLSFIDWYSSCTDIQIFPF